MMHKLFKTSLKTVKRTILRRQNQSWKPVQWNLKYRPDPSLTPSSKPVQKNPETTLKTQFKTANPKQISNALKLGCKSSKEVWNQVLLESIWIKRLDIRTSWSRSYETFFLKLAADFLTPVDSFFSPWTVKKFSPCGTTSPSLPKVLLRDPSWAHSLFVLFPKVSPLHRHLHADDTE